MSPRFSVRNLHWLRYAIFFAIFPVFALLSLSNAHAENNGPAASVWSDSDFSQVRLIAATETAGELETLKLGLHFKMKDNWKIYWRSPGDAGFPPSLDWQGSENLQATQMHWPLPERFSVLNIETLGYKHEVVLPITATVNEPGKAVRLHAALSYLACAEVCIPVDTTLALDLPAGSGTPSAHAHLINQYTARVPGDGAAVGLRIDRAEAIEPVAGPDSNGWVRVVAISKTPFENADVLIEGPDELVFNPAVVHFENDRMTAILQSRVEGIQDLGRPLAGTQVTLTIMNGQRAAETTLTLGTGSAETLGGKQISLWMILLFALMGGAILNLMPCVLPVLSIKLLGIVGHGGGETRTVRLSFIASAAGIVASFLLLASALVALKAGGAAIGWGIQFQQPWFLIGMTLVMTIFACNLWGMFEIRLPSALANLGGGVSNASGLGGHFLTGALATLLATPCSAPFLGSAIGFAMARGASEIYAVFAVLGLGLSLPYLLVAMWPRIATRLPQPGPWMVTFKKILALALAATGLWLLSVLAIQMNQIAAMLIGGLMIAVGSVLFACHKTGRRFPHLSWPLIAVLAALAFFVPGTIANGPQKQGDMQLKGLWQPFDETAIPRLVNDGKIVFVDVTAEWCITCQVNKGLVLSRDEILAQLSRPNVVAMQADWTRPSDDISRYLAGFGRYGIPFDVIYGPGAPGGIPLPELLSEKAVMDALEKAARQP